jgi:prophage DNA circulation protein
MALPANDLDVLRLYSNAKFRNVEFAIAEMRVSFSQEQVEHGYPGKDVELIEGTGRKSRVFSFRIPFRRGLGGQDPAIHFPTRWREFTEAMADGSTGVLKHPEFGDVNVKPTSWNTNWNPGVRDGVDVEAEFKETLKAADEEALIFQNKSPSADASAAARDYEAAIEDSGFEPEEPEELQPDLLSSLAQIDGLITQASLGFQNVAGQIDAYLGAIDTLIQDLQVEDNPRLQEPIDALVRLFTSVQKMAESAVGTKGREVTQKEVTNGGPISIVAGSFGMGAQDFCRLNPNLAASTSVDSGTLVLVFER